MNYTFVVLLFLVFLEKIGLLSRFSTKNIHIQQTGW